MKERELPQAKTLGEWAYLAIEKHFQKTLKHEEDVLKDRDPEALHQMRVGMRRLRSAVTGFAAAVDLPKAAREKQIAKIARRLGKLRDLDVLLDALESRYKPHLPSKEGEVLEAAVEKLAKQRREALAGVQATLKHQRYKSLKQAFKQWIEEPSYQEIASLPVQQVLPDLLLPEVSQLFLHPGWLVGLELKEPVNGQLGDRTPKAIDSELADRGLLLHSLRKQVKRVRYQMNLFCPIYGSDYANYVQDMKAIQEVLGDIQDSTVLAEVLADVLEEEVEKALPTVAEQLAQSRDRAWEKWQPLQQQYFNPETRLALRSQLLHPLSLAIEEPLVAAAEMANGANDG